MASTPLNEQGLLFLDQGELARSRHRLTRALELPQARGLPLLDRLGCRARAIQAGAAPA